MKTDVKVSKIILVTWAWIDTLRFFIYGFGIGFDPAPTKNINYRIQQSIVSLKHWGYIMIGLSVIMAILLLSRNLFFARIALTLSASLSMFWASAFLIVSIAEPSAIKFAWVNWAALALASLLAVRMPIIETE